MYIIFGNQAKDLSDRFTVLELDTFVTAQGVETAWCVVENIPLADFATLDDYRKVHSDLMQAYRQRNWEYCRNAIGGLRGRWNGELDSFYDNLEGRVKQHEINPPAEDWDGTMSAQST